MNDKDTSIYMKIYKGKHFARSSWIEYKKVVAFDLDETLGSFVDLEILWRKVQSFEPPLEFHKILDLYPEFLRHGILSILDYLYQKKRSGECEHVYIYTNNQCSPSWVKLITQYFHYKLNCPTDIFDKIIYAFKINNRRIDLWRTTHKKTYDDFIKCTLLPKSTEICFVDNSYFAEMNRERVYYIKPSSYYHSLSTKTIVDRFSHLYPFVHKKDSEVLLYRNQIQSLLKDHFVQHGRTYDHSIRYLPNREKDQLIAEKMMFHIRDFFALSKNGRTRKTKIHLGRFTRKIRK